MANEDIGPGVDGARRRLRVVVAEDTALLREGIVSLLRDAGHEVVGQARTADELVLKVRSYSPDVAIVDMRMPPTHSDEGLAAAREIRAEHPGVGILVLSSYLEPSYAAELVAEDAAGVGYLLKDRVYAVDEFLSAIDRVATGGTAFDPKVVSAMVGRSGPAATPSILGLPSQTPRAHVSAHRASLDRHNAIVKAMSRSIVFLLTPSSRAMRSYVISS